jgi:hypothetical protein
MVPVPRSLVLHFTELEDGLHAPALSKSDGDSLPREESGFDWDHAAQRASSPFSVFSEGVFPSGDDVTTSCLMKQTLLLSKTSPNVYCPALVGDIGERRLLDAYFTEAGQALRFL